MKKRILFFIAIISLSTILNAQQQSVVFPLPRAPKIRPDIKVLYRKTTKAEKEIIKPNAEDVEKYADFLKQPETGLIRFAADSGCAENTEIIVVTENCLKYTMPGGGISYSFRVNDYRIQSLADLAFFNNSFQGTGVLLHTILTKIGDVPLEKVDLQTEGLKFLVDFKPVTDYDQAQKIAQDFVKGISKDGFIYRRGLNAFENTTYVLRSIAYRGVYLRVINGLPYNEFEFDKRTDIIVAFRIVRKDADGSVTILWKKLTEKDSPKIKRKKEQKPAKKNSYKI